MSAQLAELADDVAKNVQLDAELVVFDGDGRPSFDLLSRRVLHGDRSIRVTLMVFDVLAVEGLSNVVAKKLSEPYRQVSGLGSRRRTLSGHAMRPSERPPCANGADNSSSPAFSLCRWRLLADYGSRRLGVASNSA
jgi:hypothetical protein